MLIKQICVLFLFTFTAAAFSKQPVLDAASKGMARVKSYRFTALDYPGASSTYIIDENTGGTAVGQFAFNDSSPLTAFSIVHGLSTQLAIPGLADQGSSGITAINTAGDLVGVATFGPGNGLLYAYVDIGGTFSFLRTSWAVTSYPRDINDVGAIVGESGLYGFFTADTGMTFTAIQYPYGVSTSATGINSAGLIVGVWVDSNGVEHGFEVTNYVNETFPTYTPLDFPLAASTRVGGINDAGELAGDYTDSAGVTHGFLYSSGEWFIVDVPGAAQTQLFKINNKGHVSGSYIDANGSSHGFTGM